jgi:hypothetical protein
MVAAVAAKAHWKNQSDQRPTAKELPVLVDQPLSAKALVPMKLLP